MAHGRPPASYMYPRIWDHVKELGYAPSHLALKNLRLKNSEIVFPGNSKLSSKTFETKFRYQEMRLVDYGLGHDVVHLVNHHRELKGLAKVDASTALVQFCCRVTGLHDRLSGPVSPNADPVQELADNVGVLPETILDVANGRLVPLSVATAIAGGVGLGAESIEHCKPGPKKAPVNNAQCIYRIQRVLAA